MRRFFKWVLIVLVVVLLALAVNAFIVNGEVQPATADIGRILDLPGPDLQVKELGPRDAPAIVLVHCYTCSMKWWEPDAQILSQDHRVIMVDLIGHGGSEKPRTGYDMPTQARQVWLALDKLGVDKALLVGHSMGALVVTEMTVEQPDRVDGLVAIGSSAEPGGGELPLTARLGYVPLIGQAIKRLVPDSVVRGALASAFAPGYAVPDFAIQDFRRMTYSGYQQAAARDSDYLAEKSVPDRLGAVDVPIMYIQGDQDQLVDPAKAKEGWGSISGARVESLPGSGHSPELENPDETAALIEDFGSGVQAAVKPDAKPAPKKPDPKGKGGKPAPEKQPSKTNQSKGGSSGKDQKNGGGKSAGGKKDARGKDKGGQKDSGSKKK
jgi:pimeloyl-ACP methyl ester carboxylesterase